MLLRIEGGGNGLCRCEGFKAGADDSVSSLVENDILQAQVIYVPVLRYRLRYCSLDLYNRGKFKMSLPALSVDIADPGL